MGSRARCAAGDEGLTAALVLVATPIGNLGDISHRAAEELGCADLICCEDTRRTGQLLNHLGLKVRMLRTDDHTENRVAPEVISLLEAGKRVVLVSDAGTPGVSDPGQRIVELVIAAGHAVTSVPGPSALLAALVASGLATSRFVFEGFLDRKGTGRHAQLAAIAAQPRTTIIYESPNRTAATLRDLAVECGAERSAVVARELTKLHEEFVRGTLVELATWAESGVRGEVVILISGAPPADDATDQDIRAAVRAEMAAGSSRRDAVADVAAALAVSRRRTYELALGDDSSSSST